MSELAATSNFSLSGMTRGVNLWESVARFRTSAESMSATCVFPRPCESQAAQQHLPGTTPLPVNWMRAELRRALQTPPLHLLPQHAAPEGKFLRTAAAAMTEFADALCGRSGVELLLGFPSAPFILPLTTDDHERFLEYAEAGQPNGVGDGRGGVRGSQTVIPVQLRVGDTDKLARTGSTPASVAAGGCRGRCCPAASHLRIRDEETSSDWSIGTEGAALAAVGRCRSTGSSAIPESRRRWIER